MIKYMLAALTLLSPALALATCTTVESQGLAVITCTTGTEGAANACPADNASEGMSLVGTFFSRQAKGLVVLVESAGTMTASTLSACIQNPATGKWARVPDLDLTNQALARQGWLGLALPAPSGRIVWWPVATGAVTIYLDASY